MIVHKKNKALRELRKIRGWNQKQLGQECDGYSAGTIARIEKGIAEGTIHFWRNIQLIFNIPDEAMWSIINGEDNLFKYKSAIADHAYERGYDEGFKAGREAI